jgi:hypothetical protein
VNKEGDFSLGYVKHKKGEVDSNHNQQKAEKGRDTKSQRTSKKKSMRHIKKTVRAWEKDDT